MRHLITILKPFQSAIEDMECCQTPTLHKVVPWFLHLRNTCAPDSGDTEVLAALKKSIKHCLDQNEEVNLLHKIAVFFNPRMNSLKILCPEERELVRKEVKRLAQSHIDISEPPKKRPKQESSPLAYLEDKDNEQDDDSTAEREILLYTIMKDYTDSEDLLLWWHKNSSMLPLLAAVAQRVLAVPASATPTSHLTKIAARMKDLGSSWGNEHNMDDLVFLHSRLSQSTNNSDG
nr:zinc finger protein 618-like [Procambarus clarkii]